MKDDTINDETKEKVVPIQTRLVKSARDLEVFKRAYKVSLHIHKATLTFPKIEQYALAGQLRRSTKSICANIAEGFTKQNYSSAEFGRFLGMAEASAGESIVWLQYALDLEYITGEQFNGWEDDYLAIVSMLNKLRRKLM